LKKGEKAVFQCGREILRARIVKTQEGNLQDILTVSNYKQIISLATDLEEAMAYLKKLYGSTDGIFTAYSFVL